MIIIRKKLVFLATSFTLLVFCHIKLLLYSSYCLRFSSLTLQSLGKILKMFALPVPSVWLSFCLFACLFVFIFICLSVCLSVSSLVLWKVWSQNFFWFLHKVKVTYKLKIGSKWAQNEVFQVLSKVSAWKCSDFVHGVTTA